MPPSDESTSVSVHVGEKVTVRVEESPTVGLYWSTPRIIGEGLTLVSAETVDDGGKSLAYREFVFSTSRAGRFYVTATLRQAGIETGVKTFSMIVNVLEPDQPRNPE